MKKHILCSCLLFCISIFSTDLSAQTDTPWQMKLGLMGGIGVNSMVTSKLDFEPSFIPIDYFPTNYLGETTISNLYTEMLWKDTWGISVGFEWNYIQIRRTVRMGDYLFHGADNKRWNHSTLSFLASRYVSVGNFPNKLKLSFGPDLSFYDRGGMASESAYEDEFARNTYYRLRKVNVGIRALVLWSSKVSAWSNLNIGVGVNYDLFSPLVNEISFYKKKDGVYDINALRIRPLEEDLSYKGRATLKPAQFLFIIQYELSMKKK